MKKLSFIHLYAGLFIAFLIYRFWDMIRKPFILIYEFFTIYVSTATAKQWLGLLLCVVAAAFIIAIVGGYILLLVLALINDLFGGDKKQ